jgi:hypothetical protein
MSFSVGKFPKVKTLHPLHFVILFINKIIIKKDCNLPITEDFTMPLSVEKVPEVNKKNYTHF